MTTLREGPRIQTRLSMQDYERFQHHMEAHNLSIGQLARDAICFYLDRLEKGDMEPQEHNLKERIDLMEMQLMALLETASIDIATMLSIVHSRMDKKTRTEVLRAAQQQAKQRLSRKIETLLQKTEESKTSA